MAITVIIHFPIPYQNVVDNPLDADNAAIMSDAAQRNGLTNQRFLTGEGNEFVDLFDFPSEDAYHAFKAEAAPAIEAWESLIGLGGDFKSVDRIYS